MFKPTPLYLPPYPFKLSEKNGQLFIFDELRKKHLVLTPEEWVRQHFVMFLICHKKYPKSFIKLESGVKVNTLKNRTDILVFDRNAQPLILVECKATSVKIDQQVFDQVSRYNLKYSVKYLVVSNGLDHYCCEIDYATNSFVFINELPSFY